jgi:succinoglycan biosynthesis transport protein ExoP
MNDFVELRQVTRTILRWWWLLVLAVVMSAGTSYAVSRRQTPVYEASVTILVGQSLQSTELNRGDIQASEMLAQTYSNMVQRQPVLQGAIDNLDLTESWAALRRRVHVEPVEGTQLLQISVEASSREEARVIADEIARQLILLSPSSLQNQDQDENQQFVHQRLEDLRARIVAGQDSLRAKELEAAGPLSDAEQQKIQAEIVALEALIADWENSYTQFLNYIKSEQSPNYLAVIEPAYASSRPIRPQLLINTIVAGGIGLSLALGIVFLLEFLADTLDSTEKLSRSLDLTTLGIITRIKGKGYRKKLITLQEPFSPGAEAYRMIQSNIQFMSEDRPVKSILITSPLPGEGKSLTVANLGVVMAQAGLKTIVVDANLRHPVLHQIFDVPNAKGLTDFLRNPELELADCLRNTSLENLQVLSCGREPANPSELLDPRRAKALLTRLNELAEITIFDSPSVLAASDAAVLANRVDGVLMVIKAGKTRADVARQAVSNLQQANPKFMGAVLNQFAKKYYQAYHTPKRSASPEPSARSKPRRWRQWLPILKQN